MTQPANQISIRLSKLHAGQQAVMDALDRFVVAAMGKESGKTTLAVDALLSHRYGVLRGYPVAFLSPSADGVAKAKRAAMRAIEPLVSPKSRKSRVVLTSGGFIDFLVLDDDLDIWEQYALVVIDDAHQVDQIEDVWEDSLRPLLSRYRGSGVILGKPNGNRSGFYRLFSRCGVVDDWASVTVPTAMNDRHDLSFLRDAREKMPPEAFAQEYLAEWVDGSLEFSAAQMVIGKNETFRDWCMRLADTGLKVDGHPFRLDNRQAMWFIYDMIPSEPADAFNRIDVIMKCTQVGFTVMEMLAMIYLSLKFMPCKVGMFLPDMKLAQLKSSERFMPIVRTVPDAYSLMLKGSAHVGSARGGEGNVMVRNLGDSRFHFLWTSGRATTESVPLDVVSFDEVQEMQIADMEKTRERLSASAIRYTLMGSTANWPDEDIHFWYKRGSQHQFHTLCPSCGTGQVLDEHFPACIRFNKEAGDYQYSCHACSGWILDPQVGEWIPKNPDAKIRSVHFPQFLSPTISPREIIEAYNDADDMKNFFNRKLGKPYVDPTQVPVNIEMLNECARIGMELGVVWERTGRGYFMGIDQMGNYNVVLVAKRLPTGHMAVIHAEEIYDADPFERCSVLMFSFGISVCVVETLPNYNDAKRFAARHEGKVFLASYTEIKDDMLRWGDSLRLDKSEARTSDEDRDRFTVTLDQYKCMQVAMGRIQRHVCVFPDPKGLVQDIIDKKKTMPVDILKDRVFYHLTKTALVAEKDEDEKKYRRRVVKVGIDPHFSYAYMLLNVAWARAHGTGTFLLPDLESEMSDQQKSIKDNFPGLPDQVLNMVQDAPLSGGCGACAEFDPETGRCGPRAINVKASDPECDWFIPLEG